MVLVELAAAEAPQGPDVAGTPAAVDRGEQPASMAVDSTTVERRLATLAAENDALAAGLADAELRIAAMEDAHRQEIAAHDTTANDLGERVAALTAEKEALAAELEAGRLRTAALEEELEARRKAEDAAVAELRSAHDRLVSALRQEIADKDVALEQANRRLTVSIVDRVLFPSGQATLTPEGEPVIDRIGRVLAAVPDSRILVEGHTDNVPIGPALQARFPSNWELSTARATEVVRRLIEQAAVAPARLRVAGRADTEPVASNETEDGRRRNRRIEIILLPAGEDGDPAS